MKVWFTQKYVAQLHVYDGADGYNVDSVYGVSDSGGYIFGSDDGQNGYGYDGDNDGDNNGNACECGDGKYYTGRDDEMENMSCMLILQMTLLKRSDDLG